MKSNQRVTKLAKWTITSSLVMLTTVSITANQANAGGYDDPNFLTDEENASRLVSLPAILSWDKWEKPYISGNNLCRHKNGDVICLPINIARKVGAHNYSPRPSGRKQGWGNREQQKTCPNIKSQAPKFIYEKHKNI